MRPVTGEELLPSLCKLLGIDDRWVYAVSVVARIDSVVKVTVEKHIEVVEESDSDDSIPKASN